MADDRDHLLADILGQTVWIRGLARRIVVDAAERDDVVQEAWIQALAKRHRPRAVRPWLFGVVRNVARMELRSKVRRGDREAAVPVDEATASPEQLVERVELEREVASALLELAEPFRSTLLLRYYEDLEPTEIARRLKLPAGTVRWRLKEGLERLRGRLDQRLGDDRRRWILLLVPTAALAQGGRAAAATLGGLLLMNAATKLVAAVALLLLLLAGSLALLRHGASPGEVSRARPGVAWRIPGGIGATSAAPATVAGVAVPAWFGQRGAPVRRIAGRVTFAGEPVAHATVELASELTDAGLLAPARVQTGADGRFDFGTQPPAKFSVAATADQHSAAIVEVDTRDPTRAAERLELRLGGCESTLSGHVSDSSGGSVVGARICLAPPRASACVISDGGGAYTTCLSPRQNIVSVAAAGYGAIYDRLKYVGHPVRRDYALTPEATIVGRVVRAADNAPVAGASVRVVGSDRGQRFAAPGATISDQEGRFTIGNLAGGRYRVTAFAEGLASIEAVEVNVEASHRTGELLLRLQTGSRLSGVVTNGRDAIVGATVSLGLGADSIDAVTQSDGSFVLDPVPRGLATLAVRDYELRAPKTLLIDRAAVSDVRVLVDDMGSIAGHVRFRGQLLPGAPVFPSVNLEGTLSEADGSYVAHGLPPGRYRVSAADPDLGRFGVAPEVLLAKGEHRTGVDIETAYGGSIAGVVVEADGTPVGGVSVGFNRLDRDDSYRDFTAPDGSFRVRSLMGGGTYRAFVYAAARSQAPLRFVSDPSPTVELADGSSEVTGVRLVVQRDHLPIAGTTVDGDGQPLSDVRVVAFRTDDPNGAMLDDWFQHASAISAADGHYAIDDLDRAGYVLRARAGDGSEGIVRGVAAGQKNVVITLQRAGAIEGTLVGFSTRPAVRAVGQLGVQAGSVFATVDDAGFHFRGLSPGSYQVAAVGSESDAKPVEVVSGQVATVTLRSRGVTTLRGRVVDWSSGAGATGLRCLAGLRGGGGGRPVWIESLVGFTDESGAFVLEGVPTGEVSVACHPNVEYWTNGKSDLTLGAGQDAACEVPVVRRDPDAPEAKNVTGAELEPSVSPVRVSVVTPRGPAARAGLRVGDVVLTVDGASVTGLTPWGVDTVIAQRPAGATAHLGVSRGGQNVAVDLVVSAQ